MGVPAIPYGLNTVISVWGVGSTSKLSDYRRGGVATPDIAAFNVVANSTGTLKLSQFASLRSPRTAIWIDGSAVIHYIEANYAEEWYTAGGGTITMICYAPLGHTTYGWFKSGGGTQTTCSNTAIRNPTFTSPAGTYTENWGCAMTTGNTWITYYFRIRRS